MESYSIEYSIFKLSFRFASECSVFTSEQLINYCIFLSNPVRVTSVKPPFITEVFCFCVRPFFSDVDSYGHLAMVTSTDPASPKLIHYAVRETCPCCEDENPDESLKIKFIELLFGVWAQQQIFFEANFFDNSKPLWRSINRTRRLFWFLSKIF